MMCVKFFGTNSLRIHFSPAGPSACEIQASRALPQSSELRKLRNRRRRGAICKAHRAHATNGDGFIEFWSNGYKITGYTILQTGPGGRWMLVRLVGEDCRMHLVG